MTLVKWNPLKEMAALQNSINKLFDENFRIIGKGEHGGFIQDWSFPVDIKETEDQVIITAEVPGISREDLKINFTGNQLTIHGERKSETKEEDSRFIRVERNYGRFSRTFTVDVPVKPEEIKAKYRDGVLEIYLPKRELSKPKEIAIEVE
ncbi:MAG: Hsp20/alpha crystallin family protein [Bacillota bacterium]